MPDKRAIIDIVLNGMSPDQAAIYPYHKDGPLPLTHVAKVLGCHITLLRKMVIDMFVYKKLDVVYGKKGRKPKNRLSKKEIEWVIARNTLRK